MNRNPARRPRSQDVLGALRFLEPLVRRYAWRLTVGFLCLAAVDILQLWIPRVMKHAIDGVSLGHDSDQLAFRAAQIIALALLIAVLRYFWRHFLLGFSRFLEKDIRRDMVVHVLTLDRIALHKRSSGDILALSGNDLASVQLAAGMGLVAFVDAVFMSLATLAFMAALHGKLTAIAVAPLPFLALATQFLSSRLHERFVKVQEKFSELTECARTTLASIRLFKAYNQEEAQTKRFDVLGRAYVHHNLRAAMVEGTLFPFAGLVGNTSVLLVLYFGGLLTMKGTITTGDFVAFITYLHLLTWPMMAFGWVANLFQRGLTSLQRIQDLLNDRPALSDPPKSVCVPAAPLILRLHECTFTYPGMESPVLHECSLTLEPGITGLVGPTGAGKSTVCHLLVRLYPVPRGTYTVNGRDVNDLSLTDLRSLIAYVPQEGVLFSDTVAANIAFGKPYAERKDIEAAARAAAIHEEILAMPSGYDTRIGEKGVLLSGGQRQRIALARALLLDRPVLIIDDGLSAVDTETEHLILEHLRRYCRGKTCLIISHRIAQLMDAGRLLVMENGRMVDAGTHHDLLVRNAFYRTIYQHQTRSECVR
ncbi:MAG: ABC transporter ATP-binding protein [Desulfosoma sp.]